MRVLSVAGGMGLLCLVGFAKLFAQQESEPSTFEKSFVRDVRPLLNRYCVTCHEGERAEAEIDLSDTQTFADLSGHLELWQRIRMVLSHTQMPPEDSPQPTELERAQLNQWVHGWLKRAAASQAGDPGPVILRRLSNAEYNYTIHDLTNVDSLSPTQEFPVDGAAGEGFTNSGAAQGMSPALMSKYLDAAHEVARHVVLLPEGIRFSPFTSRRDHSDEHLRKIQDFYRRFTDEGGGMPVDLQGITFDTNHGGVIPLARYLQATVEHREELLCGKKTIENVAKERLLNAKYLSRLWHALNRYEVSSPSLGLAELKKKWMLATAADIAVLVTEIEQAQKSLWRFNPVGQIGRAGGPASWMEAISPFVASHELSLPLPNSADHDFVVYLAASDLGDGNSEDFVEWQRPRIEFDNGRPPILLRDLRALCTKIEARITAEAPATSRYLAAVRELHNQAKSLEALAQEVGLNPKLLTAWANLVGLGPVSREVHGHLTEPLAKIGGYDAINGWGSPQTPSIVSNSSDDTITFLTITLPPRSVFVHPSPTLESVIAWRSPLDGKVKLEGTIADADGNCGNGVQWSVQHKSTNGTTIIAQGEIANGSQSAFASPDGIDIRCGDVFSLVIHPNAQDHACDTTQVDLTVTVVDGQKQIWNLATDIVDRIQEANPLADSMGIPEIWHFCALPVGSNSREQFSPDSTIALWRAAVINAQPIVEIQSLEKSLQKLMTTVNLRSLSDSDRALRKQLLAWDGPLHWMDELAKDSSGNRSEFGLDAAMFGTSPNGSAIDASNLCLQAPHILELKLPAQFLLDATFRVTGTLNSSTSDSDPVTGGSVQLRVSNSRPDEAFAGWSEPIVANRGSSRDKLEQDLDKFRELFPAALCYSRIVPVDEAVTLTLYHREDSYLQRTMLNEEQRAEIDLLWDQLYFVSQEPLLLTTAFEQITEFATQDRPDLVTAFAPMRKSIYDRAEAFKTRMIQSESSHLTAVQAFAQRAWRRPLSPEDQQKIRSFYLDLRKGDLPHHEAIELTLARVMTSPAFLYKLEQVGDGTQATSISQFELANRLSYFLWSSLPDERLFDGARRSQLIEVTSESIAKQTSTNTKGKYSELLVQTNRLLNDARIRRLAIQFACQWLHVRDFHQNNDKNEQLFPEFVDLRHDMYEETVHFFEDMFRNDGSILTMIDGDHAFVNESIAKVYGIEGIRGTQWRKIGGMRARGRGGILGMATILASQSGASRTSPILRGVWISETLLGERLPRPPANVPKLPEIVPDGLTSRKLIELHSGQPECAKCHVRIDPYGFALEQFDAIGRTLPVRVDTRTQLIDGTEIDGIAGLETYLATTRRDEIVRQFCRKLLGFALGREVLLSDEPLLDEMQESLSQNGYRFSVAVNSIVTSPQFLNIRGQVSNQ